MWRTISNNINANSNQQLDDLRDALAPFNEGITLWSRQIATAKPEIRGNVFLNCCREAADFVRKGAPVGMIADELLERAERHELVEKLGGAEAVEDIIARTLHAEPEPPPLNDPVDDLDVWDAGEDAADIPPRGWLLGNSFCRGFVSSLIGEGGTGKSAVRMTQLMSAAIFRQLTGEHMFVRSRVLLVSLEDDRNEQRRRLRAACSHHNIKQSDLKGWMFLSAPGLKAGKILSTDRYGRPVKGTLAAKLARQIEKHKIDIVSLDPFIKAHTRRKQQQHDRRGRAGAHRSGDALRHRGRCPTPHLEGRARSRQCQPWARC
jgi:hypothetical protein